MTTAKGNRLKSNDCPVYIVGHSNEYILVGLNPGYSAINNPAEKIEARKSWEHYLDFYQYKFFKSFDATGVSISLNKDRGSMTYVQKHSSKKFVFER